MKAISILLVDDSQSFLGMVARFLERSSDLEIVGSAQDRADALEKVRDLQPQIILVDLSMPERNGLELIRDLRQLVPDVGIVVLTLWDMEAYRRAAFSLGADEFVSKITMHSDLLPAIWRLAKRIQNGVGVSHRVEESRVDL